MQQPPQQQILTIFHFNDIYNIQPYTQQPKGGAAYFQSLLQRQKKKYKHPLTLFSGDAFSPALISYQFQGQNMIKPLNAFGIDLACYGNHDFDYQLDHVSKLVKQTNFPWLLSNIYDKRTGRRLGQALETYIFHGNGLKIGVFSLAEKEWIDTLYPYYKTICDYHPFIPFAQKMVHKLRTQQQCNLVIALTHMMKYNDIKLAKQVKGIDLVLGGHDHLIAHEKIADSVMVKSGTDFKHFSVIKIHKNIDKNVKETFVKGDSTFLSNKWWNFEVELKQVHHQNQKIQPDQELDHYIQEMYKELKVKNQKIACFTKKQIDLRFNTIRKEQTPYLQFLVSIYRHQSSADIAMMNSGNFRMDTLVKPGPITFGVIQNIITDTVIVKIVPADILVQALEVSVSMYPNLAGRYSVFSGIGFNWDASKKPLQRVVRQSILIHGQPIDMNRTYSLAIHSFVGDGGDGYQCLKQCQTRKGDGDKTNRQLLHDLLHVNHYLLDSYIAKYPNRFNIIQHEGRQCLELDVPDAKNVHMVLSTGHVYGH